MRKNPAHNRAIVNPGDIFKNWQVLEEIEPKIYGKHNPKRMFLCKCLLCENNYEISLQRLRSEDTNFCCKSCAHSDNEITIGSVYKSWKVIEEIDTRDGMRFFNCECLECNDEYEISYTSLRIANKYFCCVNCAILFGEDNPSWNGGKSTQNKFDRFQLMKYANQQIRERDNYTCQNCNNSGIYLNVHHIFDFSNYQELRFEESNLITLCKTCHDNFHSIYPKTGTNTLADLESWMNKPYQYRNDLIAIKN